MKVFLSYHTPDDEYARGVRDALGSARADWDIFHAPTKLKTGAFWLPKLAEEIAKSDAFILLVGNKIGPYQELEYYEAISRRMEAQRKGAPYPLVPLVIRKSAPGMPFLSTLHMIDAAGSDPSAVVAGVIAGIEDPDSSKDSQPWRLVNPYRGLHAMTEEDADFFYGREALSSEIIDRLATPDGKITALLGNSGVGKSSVVSAGVFGALKQQRWPGNPDKPWPEALKDSRAWLYLTMTPDKDPFERLAFSFVSKWEDQKGPAAANEADAWAKRLSDPDRAPGRGLDDLLRAADAHFRDDLNIEPPRRYVLNIDQGEELYGRNLDDPDLLARARRFSEIIAAATEAGQILTLATFRSDHFGAFQDDTRLFNAAATLNVVPFGEAELADVIRRPPEKLGVRFQDSQLPEQIARAARKRPGALPLLSYLLEDMWKEMQERPDSDGTLRWPKTEIVIGDALVRRADQFVDQHPDKLDDIKRLFCVHLADVPRDGLPVRRRAWMNELSQVERDLVGELADQNHRLLVTDRSREGEATVEVAHEILLREWPRLSDWLADRKRFHAWRGQLDSLRRQWEKADSSDKNDALLGGLTLQTAQVWLHERKSDFSEANSQYVDLSIQHAAHIDRSTKLRRRIVLVGLACLATLAAGGAWYGLDGQRRAQLESATAKKNEIRAISLNALLLANIGHLDSALRMLLRPLTNTQFKLSVASKDILASTLRQLRFDSRLKLVMRGHKLFLWSAEFSPNGRRVLTASADSTLRIWNSKTGKLLRVLTNHKSDVVGATYDPTGRYIASASQDSTVRIWNTKAYKNIVTLKGPERDRFFDPGFSKDGQLLIVGVAKNNTARVYRWKVQKIEFETQKTQRDLSAVAISPDGSRIALGYADGTVFVLDIKQKDAKIKIRPNDSKVTSLTFSKNGRKLLASFSGRKIFVLDSSNGNSILEITDSHDIEFAQYGPAENIILSSSEHGQKVVLRSARTGKKISEYRGHGSSIRTAQLSPDGTFLLTAGDDRTARIWYLNPKSRKTLIRSNKLRHRMHLESVTKNLFVYIFRNGTANIWDLRYRRFTKSIIPENGKYDLSSISPNGKYLVLSKVGEKHIELRNMLTKSKKILIGHNDIISSLSFSPNGEYFLSSSEDGKSILWKTKTGIRKLDVRGHDKHMISAAFSKNGELFVTTSRDNTARIYRTKNGALLSVLSGHSDWVMNADFGPNGRFIVTSSYDQTARIWEVKTGRIVRILKDVTGHYNFLNSARYSIDGKKIATSSDDRSIKIWSASNGKLLFTIKNQLYRVTDAIFLEEKWKILGSVGNGNLYLWDISPARTQENIDWANTMLEKP